MDATSEVIGILTHVCFENEDFGPEAAVADDRSSRGAMGRTRRLTQVR